MRLALDFSSDYLVIESELCHTCHNKTYKPGHSKTTDNQAKMWELEYDESDVGFKVIEFKDTICINDSCLLSHPFYVAYQQTGKLARDIDGIIGIGTKSSEEPSLLKRAVKDGLIHRAMLGLSLQEDGGELMFGDYDSQKI